MKSKTAGASVVDADLLHLIQATRLRNIDSLETRQPHLCLVQNSAFDMNTDPAH